MMKKIALGVLILLAAFVSLIIAAQISETLFIILFAAYSLFLIGAPLYFVVKLISAKRAKKRARRRRRRPAAAKAATPPARPAQTETKPASVRRLHFPEDFDGKQLAYKYENVGVYVPSVSAAEGIEYAQVAILEREPDNKFDPGAVAVYARCSGSLVKIGYLYRGRIQNMANDWLKSDAPIFCQFSRADKQDANASKDGFKINIAFYK